MGVLVFELLADFENQYWSFKLEIFTFVMYFNVDFDRPSSLK